MIHLFKKKRKGQCIIVDWLIWLEGSMDFHQGGSDERKTLARVRVVIRVHQGEVLENSRQ